MLNILSNNQGATKVRKRIGRGIASGTGKTCGRGVKGQKSRSGVAIKGFEGGQMPIHRRLPKRGFNSLSKIKYNLINISDLQKLIDNKKIKEETELNAEILFNLGIIRNATAPLKLLADGEINVSLKIKLNKASKSSIEKIEKAGGEVLFF